MPLNFNPEIPEYSAHSESIILHKRLNNTGLEESRPDGDSDVWDVAGLADVHSSLIDYAKVRLYIYIYIYIYALLHSNM